MLGTIRVKRNVRDGAAVVDGGCTVEAAKGLHRLRIYRYLPRLREALADRANRQAKVAAVAVKRKAAQAARLTTPRVRISTEIGTLPGRVPTGRSLLSNGGCCGPPPIRERR